MTGEPRPLPTWLSVVLHVVVFGYAAAMIGWASWYAAPFAWRP